MTFWSDGVNLLQFHTHTHTHTNVGYFEGCCKTEYLYLSECVKPAKPRPKLLYIITAETNKTYEERR